METYEIEFKITGLDFKKMYIGDSDIIVLGEKE